MSWQGERNCNGCRYWSDMLARAGGGTTNPRGDVEAMCLGPGPFRSLYTTAERSCPAFGRDTHGKVDGPPNYGEIALAHYAEEAAARHPSGAPKFSPDGTMLDEHGNRSIFDDVDL